MKTLLLVLFLQMPLILPFDSGLFIDKNKSEFEYYCNENGGIYDKEERDYFTIIKAQIGNKPVFGYYKNDTIYRINFYFDKHKYKIEDIVEKMNEKCAFLSENNGEIVEKKWINFPERTVIYELYEHEDWYIINTFKATKVED